jgi:hypothetical protein
MVSLNISCIIMVIKHKRQAIRMQTHKMSLISINMVSRSMVELIENQLSNTPLTRESTSGQIIA